MVRRLGYGLRRTVGDSSSRTLPSDSTSNASFSVPSTLAPPSSPPFTVTKTGDLFFPLLAPSVSSTQYADDRGTPPGRVHLSEDVKSFRTL